jgi:hypothetical protein
LVFVVVGALVGFALFSLLNFAFQTPLVWAAIASAPLAVFFGAMASLVRPIRGVVLHIVGGLLWWTPWFG